MTTPTILGQRDILRFWLPLASTWLMMAFEGPFLAALIAWLADLAIVGGGFTGLWAALQAKEDAPDRDIVLIEFDRVAQGATGRNGGFADPSLTHGLWNGQGHFPDEWEEIERLVRENYRGFVS